jgi:hypothetical protein
MNPGITMEENDNTELGIDKRIDKTLITMI